MEEEEKKRVSQFRGMREQMVSSSEIIHIKTRDRNRGVAGTNAYSVAKATLGLGIKTFPVRMQTKRQ